MNKKSLKDFIKKNIWLIVLFIILIISFIIKNFFIFSIIAYALFIKLLMSKYINGNIKKILEIIIWISCFLFFILTFCVNYLTIDNFYYGVFFLKNNGVFLGMVLAITGIILNKKDEMSNND